MGALLIKAKNCSTVWIPFEFEPIPVYQIRDIFWLVEGRSEVRSEGLVKVWEEAAMVTTGLTGLSEVRSEGLSEGRSEGSEGGFTETSQMLTDAVIRPCPPMSMRSLQVPYVLNVRLIKHNSSRFSQ